MASEKALLIKKEANLLSYGYCRDYSKSEKDVLIPSDVQYIIFLFFGINNEKTTIDRYGFFTKQTYTYSGRDRLQDMKKEHEKLEKWMQLLFPVIDSNNQTNDDSNKVSFNGDQKITQNWDNIQNNKNLKSLIREGIPSSLRGPIWKCLCGAMKRKQMDCIN